LSEQLVLRNSHCGNIFITALGHEFDCLPNASRLVAKAKHLLDVVPVKIHYQKGLILGLGPAQLESVLDTHYD
jgi:hypothetical protein